MNTKQRIGIDIVAKFLGAGFDQVERRLKTLETRFISFGKLATVAFLGGNIMRNAIHSLVEINKHVAPVKTSFETMGRAWQDFALRAGKGGLNDAMIDFSNRMSQMTVGLGTLSSAIGAFLGGALNGLTQAFEIAGRAIGFVGDNLDVVTRALQGFLNVNPDKPKKIIDVDAIALNWLKEMGFNTKALTQDFSAAQGKVAALPPTFAETEAAAKKLQETQDKLRASWQGGIVGLQDYVYQLEMQKQTFGMAEGAAARYAKSFEFYNQMQRAGVKLTADQRKEAEGWLNLIPGLTATVENQKKTLKASEEAARSWKQTMQGITQTFAGAFTQAFDSLIDGTSSVKKAFASMAKSILSSLASMAANKFFTGLFSSLVGGFAGGGGGLAASFNGLYAKGGKIPAGKWGIVGDEGPEPVFGPSTVLPNSSLGGKGGGGVTVLVKIDARGADEPGLARVTAQLSQLQRTLPQLIKSTMSNERIRNPGFA